MKRIRAPRRRRIGVASRTRVSDEKGKTSRCAEGRRSQQFREGSLRLLL